MHYGPWAFTICNVVGDGKWTATPPLAVPDNRCQMTANQWDWRGRVVGTGVSCDIECATILNGGATFIPNRSTLSELDIAGIENRYPIPTSINRVFLQIYKRIATAEDINNNAAGFEDGTLTEAGLLNQIARQEVIDLYNQVFKPNPTEAQTTKYVSLIVDKGKSLREVKATMLMPVLIPILFKK